MYRLNIYTPILKTKVGKYKFLEPVGENNQGRFIEISISESDTFNLLLSKEAVCWDDIIKVFGKENALLMIEYNILINCAKEEDNILNRSIAFFNQYDLKGSQETLRNKKVLILGCGGIGTHLAWHMAILGIKQLTLLDYDKVELSNLNRQSLYSTSDKGRFKVDVLSEKLAEINPTVSIKTVQQKISSEQELERVCTEDSYDLIIKALDSPIKLPLWLDNVCKKHSLSYIAGITFKDKAMIGPTYIHGKSEYGWSDFVNVEIPEEKIFGTVSSLGVILNYISSELAIEALKVLTNKGKLKYINQITLYDVYKDETEYLIKKNPPKKVLLMSRYKFIINLVTVFLAFACTFISPWFLLVLMLTGIIVPILTYSNKNAILKTVFINSIFLTISLIIKTNHIFTILNVSNILIFIVSLILLSIISLLMVSCASLLSKKTSQ